jgi:hypothetical protein
VKRFVSGNRKTGYRNEALHFKTNTSRVAVTEIRLLMLPQWLNLPRGLATLFALTSEALNK